jgi:acyl transferase domain-containing protein
LQLDSIHSGRASQQYRIFVVTGFDEKSCHEQVRRLRDYLSVKQELIDSHFMDDLAFTLNECRSHFMWKAGVIGTTVADLIDTLAGTSRYRSSVRKPTLAFIFTGQGAQWTGMGRELLQSYPIFRKSIAMIDAFLETLRAQFSIYGTQHGRQGSYCASKQD